jgi:hypothetical protein
MSNQKLSAKAGQLQGALVADLKKAMKNRQADVGLGILTNSAATCGPIFHQDDIVIVCLPEFGDSAVDHRLYEELVALGYEMARFLAIRSLVSPLAEFVDLARLTECVDELRAASQRFATLKDNHTRIVTAVQTAKDTAETIRDAVLAAGSKLKAVIEAETAKIAKSGIAAQAA